MASAVTEVTRQPKAAWYRLILALVILAVIAGWFLAGGNKAKQGVVYVGLDAYVYGYPLVMMDVSREVLTTAPTSGEYAAPIMHFKKGGLSPSKAGVWSISPYRGNFYVPNSLNRYGILFAVPLKYNTDVSLNIYLQKDPPGADRESNWRPIPPSGMFNLTVRSYQPGEGLLDGSCKLPPAVKV